MLTKATIMLRETFKLKHSTQLLVMLYKLLLVMLYNQAAVSDVIQAVHVRGVHVKSRLGVHVKSYSWCPRQVSFLVFTSSFGVHAKYHRVSFQDVHSVVCFHLVYR